MDPSLPEPLRVAIAAMSEGRSGRDLAERSAEISRLYRAQLPSSRAVRSEADALAYALTRMPATYAAVAATLDALSERAPDFAPRTLLDAGCGPGTAAWAAVQTFPSLDVVHLLDASTPFLDLAKRFAVTSEDLAIRTAKTTLGDITASHGEADLVVVAYALTELSEAHALHAAEQLWAASRGVLMIVEPGTPDAWARLIQVRSMLINMGAVVIAPCSHHAPCPLAPPDWCHFAQRLPRSRAHIAAKGASAPYEDEKFAYLVVARPGVIVEPARARVLAPVVEDKAGVTLKLCTQEGRLEAQRIAKRDKAGFKAVRKARWGDAV